MCAAADTACSIDPRSHATPAAPPVPLHQLDLTAAERDIHAKLVDMFAHQVASQHRVAPPPATSRPSPSPHAFASQPIWTRRGICRSLALNVQLYGASAQFLRLLGSVSYRFQDGPFHNSCVLPTAIRRAPLTCAVLNLCTATSGSAMIRARFLRKLTLCCCLLGTSRFPYE